MTCLFCQIVEEEIPADIVYQDEDILAFSDINPQAPTHKLIIPRKHIATLNDFSENDWKISGRLLACAKDLAKKYEFDESGYRVVMNTNAGAGQTVFHIHLHLLGGRPFNWPPG
jgi:histidine triad (HIT) family protein